VAGLATMTFEKIPRCRFAAARDDTPFLRRPPSTILFPTALAGLRPALTRR